MKNNTDTGGYGSTTFKYTDPILPWFKVIVYRKGGRVVIDRYTGDQKFIGQSIYYNKKKKPIFGFNYYGQVTDRRFLNNTDKLFDFLKKALRAGDKTPYRGLDGFKSDGFSYRNKHQVKSGFISGSEGIFYNGRVVYRLYYLAGDIQDKRNQKTWKRHLCSSQALSKKLLSLW